MNRDRMKISVLLATGTLAGALMFGLNTLEVQATGLSNMLPTAGFSLTVEGGSSIAQVKTEVKTIVDRSAKAQEAKATEKKAEVTLSVTKSSDDATDTGVEEETTGTEVVETHTIAEVAEHTIDFDKEIVAPMTYADIPEELLRTDEEKEFYNLVIAKVNDYVNVRDYPDENEGNIVGKLYDKSVGNFIEEQNGWYKIQSGNCTGFVKAEYCVTGDDAIDLAKEVGTRLARVNTTTLKVREEASLDASVLGLVPIDEELVVIEELEGWVKVDIEEGYGYVSNEFVDFHTEFVKAESKEEEEARLAKEKAERDKANAAARRAAATNEGTSGSHSSGSKITVGGSGIGSSVCNYALQFVGNPYVYGGSSLTHGTDCSGFVMSVYRNFGVSLPHSSSADRSVGYDVGGLGNAQPGDIVCYSGHVAIYIGGGQIVHASTSKTGIIVSNATYRNPICVRRIF